MSRGGARKGAGRKPVFPMFKKVPVSLRLYPETKEEIDRLCVEHDISKAELLAVSLRLYEESCVKGPKA